MGVFFKDPLKPTIIAFSGKRGVGKSTAAKFLELEHGFVKSSFATPLKELARQIFPFDHLDFSEQNKEIKYKMYDWTPREFMINLGKFCRYYDVEYFVKRLKINPKTVIDDLRFKNEYDYLKRKGAVLVRISRYEKQNPYKTVLNDSSETELDNEKFDYEINEIQNESLYTMQKRLNYIISKVFEEK